MARHPDAHAQPDDQPLSGRHRWSSGCSTGSRTTSAASGGSAAGPSSRRAASRPSWAHTRQNHRRPTQPPARARAAVRPCVHDPSAARADRLGDRGRGQPPDPGQRLRRLPVARRPLRRPLAAARRWSAQRRRRLPPRLPHADAAGVPSRPHRRGGRDDDRGGACRRRAATGWRCGRGLPLGARARAADRVAQLCSDSTPPAGASFRWPAAFEASLAIHGEPVLLQMLPLPRSPLARAISARRALDALVRAEIEARRRRGDPGPGVLGLLLSATDDAGSAAAGPTWSATRRSRCCSPDTTRRLPRSRS